MLIGVTFAKIVSIASLSAATTYGYGEFSCTNGRQLIPCAEGAITASGDRFHPNTITAAIWWPGGRRKKFQKFWTYISVRGIGKCTRILINDKKGSPGIDLTPGALRALGVKANRRWSGFIEMCTPPRPITSE